MRTVIDTGRRGVYLEHRGLQCDGSTRDSARGRMNVVVKISPGCPQVRSVAEAENTDATVEPATAVNAMMGEEMKEWKKAD